MWLKDPVTKKRSVSLTFATITFIAVLVSGTLEILEKVKSTGPFLELFYGTLGMYITRRFSFSSRGLSVNSGNKEEEEVK